MGWYEKRRKRIHFIVIIFSVVLIYMLAKTNLFTHEAFVITGREELERFYVYSFAGYLFINDAVWKMLIAVTALLVLSYFYSYVNDRAGLILYNAAVIIFTGLLTVYMTLVIIVSRCFMWMFIPLIIAVGLLVAVIFQDIKYYLMYRDSFYDESKPVKLVIALIICAGWFVYCAVPVISQIPARYVIRYNYYIESEQASMILEFGNLYELSEDKIFYTQVWFVNNFNNEGETYNIDELASAGISLMNDDGKSWYRLKQFYESYDEVWEDNYTAFSERFLIFHIRQCHYQGYTGSLLRQCVNMFSFCVERRLKTQGIDLEEANYADIDAACEYVAELYTSEDSLEAVDTISVTIAEPRPGEKPEFDIKYDEGNGYTAYVTGWDKSEGPYPEEELSELTEDDVFEDDSRYRACIKIERDINYNIYNEVMVELPNVDYYRMDYRKTYAFNGDTGDLYIWVWFLTGEDSSSDDSNVAE